MSLNTHLLVLSLLPSSVHASPPNTGLSDTLSWVTINTATLEHQQAKHPRVTANTSTVKAVGAARSTVAFTTHVCRLTRGSSGTAAVKVMAV